MDERRLSTGDVLSYGIIDKPIPETNIPKDREQVSVYIDEMDAEKITAAIERGAVVHCSEYYGIPYIWKEGESFRGILLQYRSVTEDQTFETVGATVEWFTETTGAVAG